MWAMADQINLWLPELVTVDAGAIIAKRGFLHYESAGCILNERIWSFTKYDCISAPCQQ